MVPGFEDSNRVRHTVLWMRPQNVGEGASKVVIAANTLPSFTLEDKARTVGFNALGLVLGQAVMTEDRSKLVFSVKAGASTDILAVAQNSQSLDFDEAGGAVTGINTADDEVEPWINSDCTKL